jgi:hypothetical protein
VRSLGKLLGSSLDSVPEDGNAQRISSDLLFATLINRAVSLPVRPQYPANFIWQVAEPLRRSHRLLSDVLLRASLGPPIGLVSHLVAAEPIINERSIGLGLIGALLQLTASFTTIPSETFRHVSGPGGISRKSPLASQFQSSEELPEDSAHAGAHHRRICCCSI